METNSKSLGFCSIINGEYVEQKFRTILKLASNVLYFASNTLGNLV